MSTPLHSRAAPVRRGSVRDYIKLTKLMLNLFVVATTLAGFALASGAQINWGLLLCCAGILGGVLAGIISDHIFGSRRGPVACLLYGFMLAAAITLTFVYDTGIVGWMVILMSITIWE